MINNSGIIVLGVNMIFVKIVQLTSYKQQNFLNRDVIAIILWGNIEEDLDFTKMMFNVTNVDSLI